MTAEAEPVGDGKTIGQLEAEERERDLARVITVRCADCMWETEGPQRDARMEWAEHRRDAHGDDQAVEKTRRALDPQNGRRPGAPKVGDVTQDVAANAARVRAQGGGHGMAVDPKVCKIDGCDRPRHDRAGPYGALCKQHKQEKQAARAAGTVKPPPVVGHPEGTPAAQVAPDPASTQTPRAAPEGTSNGTLVSLAQAVEDALTRYQQARQGLSEATARLRDALPQEAPAA